jgi:predicted CoA-binding protein
MGFGPGAACDIGMNTQLTQAERERYQNTDVIRDILNTAKTIAIVGLSSDKQKASYFVGSYLQYQGYRIIPVSPKGGEILGQPCYPDLASIPEKVDLVDIFRPASEVMPIVGQAIDIKAKAVWLQLRIMNFEAADKALAAGLQVVMDKCVKMEHGRYLGGLHWAGMNTEIISARRSACS